MAIEPSGGAAAPNEPSAALADAPASEPGAAFMAETVTTATTTTPRTPDRARPGFRLAVANVLTKLSPIADDAVRAAEPVSPHVYAETPTTASGRNDGGGAGVGGRGGGRGGGAGSIKLAYVRLVLAATCGIAGSVLLVATSPVWRLAPADTWRVSLLDHPVDSSFYAGATFVVGILLMSLGWLGLIGHMRRRVGSDKSRLKWLLVVTVLWSIPLLLGPIQLSTDAYSYSAQGDMASLGIDPAAHGPSALPNHGNNPFWRAADPIWRDAPAPYGPVSVGLGKATVTVTGFDVSHAVWGFRFLATAGVIMAGVGVFLIARTKRVSAPMALALAIANPVVLVHLLGGAHNDALMMGLLVLGVAAFERGRKILAVVLVTLAVAVKLPAILALAFFAYQWKGRDAEWRERLLGFPIVGAIATSIIVALSFIAGTSLGWITALSGTGKVYSTFAVFTKLGFLTSDLLTAVGIHIDQLTVVGIARDIGLLVASGAIAALIVKSPKLGVAKSVGLALLVLILCGPVVWPWYLPAGFALLAAAGIGRYRPTLIVLVVSASLLVWPTSVNAIDGLSRYQHWLGFLVVLIIAAACVGAQYVARLTARYHQRRGFTDLYEADDTDERVLEEVRPAAAILAGVSVD